MFRNRFHDVLRRHGNWCRVAILLLSGLFVIAPVSAALAQNTPAATSAADHRFSHHIAEAAQRFRIPEPWIRAVLDAESAQHIGAVSSAGAMGLMQIMPDTWDELHVRHRLGDDPFDPRDNILAGAAYLRAMLQRYGNVGAMLAAYNAGPGRYDEFLSTGRPLPAETRDYVAELAPRLGVEPLVRGAATTASQSTDWREASLFVMPAGGGSPAGSLHPSGQSETPSPADSARHDGTATPQPEGIFVARSDADSQP